MQTYSVIEEGDLVDYLDGVLPPELAEVIEASPEHLQRLSQLRQIDNQLKDVFSEAKLLDPQDLVDVAADQATPIQRLIVAAHCRRSPEIAAEFAELKQIWNDGIVPADEEKISWLKLFPLLSASLVTAGLGVKSTSHPQQAYEVIELKAKAVVHTIPPEENDFWLLKGQVTQDNQPVIEANVMLSGDQMENITTSTDSSGFFTFEEISEGTCQIYIDLPEGMMYLSNIILDDDLDAFS